MVKGQEASLTDELKAAAKGLKEKYAVYYVHVLSKIADNADHVEKELKRLEGMATSGLAPATYVFVQFGFDLLRKSRLIVIILGPMT